MSPLPPSAFVAPTPLSRPTRRCAPPRCSRASSAPRASAARPVVTVLDYGAGNVRSLHNALRLLDVDVQYATTAQHILDAERLIFPGVGSFGAAMANLRSRHFDAPLRRYIADDRPFLGICLGLHTLFAGSDESPEQPGLAVFPAMVRRFRVDRTHGLAVPHIGWNSVSVQQSLSVLPRQQQHSRFYFVHSFRVAHSELQPMRDVRVALCEHGESFVAALQRGNVIATQFHPEKSGADGLRLLRNFVRPHRSARQPQRASPSEASHAAAKRGLAKRVVACLDVRENDDGDLVVTKGDQYDVRHAHSGRVRNLGKPVSLAKRYFEQGADEICFLNITSFRGEPVNATPMLEVLRQTSEHVFVPLCIGGGIRDYVDRSGVKYSALDVAATYFRAGADKVSLGSDAVYAAERFWKQGKDGNSSIERISYVYGAQAVVVSLDPRRVFLAEGEQAPFEARTVTLDDGRRCWYQCTVKGGREARPIDVVRVAVAAQQLGAGELLLNCMDYDGQKRGFDVALIRAVREAVSIPVIASSGAGAAEHFTQCFEQSGAEAALAAGIFHRDEVRIEDVKKHMLLHGTPVRLGAAMADVLRVNKKAQT
eukprot:TRINITY_DN444_c3_g4_i1.p2 TRINITY_DN444_c3_g4~~TRINITY_DN444_c3_g4_i1.p2  ORF type:complete len:623 (-),score=144.05 TRINITY_DN444_c3_g4_i1:3110-4897(-)